MTRHPTQPPEGAQCLADLMPEDEDALAERPTPASTYRIKKRRKSKPQPVDVDEDDRGDTEHIVKQATALLPQFILLEQKLSEELKKPSARATFTWEAPPPDAWVDNRDWDKRYLPNGDRYWLVTTG